MKNNVIKLCVYALIFGGGAAFAGESGDTGNAPVQMKMAEMPDVSTGTVKRPGTGRKEKKLKARARKVTKKEIGKEAVCPVTGDRFKVTAETGSAAYKGKVYYFCCPDCDAPFLENPEKYLPQKKTPHHKIYVCPMGDYQGDMPGKCPKCGMNLIEKK